MEPSEQRASGDGKYIPIITALIGLFGTLLVAYWQFRAPKPEPAPAPQATQAAAPASPEPQPSEVATPAPDADQETDQNEVSREFLVGRWQVEQAVGQFSGGAIIIYAEDGTFSGWTTQFVNGMGYRMPVEGRWDYGRLSKDRFRLYLEFSSGQPPQQATFKILDRNHILNTDQNYVAIRLE
jgi:hypothetical protein